MDPDATLKLMMDESNDLDERAVAATDLLVWMAAGGFAPISAQRQHGMMSGSIVIDECKYHIFKALDRLAALEDGVGAYYDEIIRPMFPKEDHEEV